MSLNLVWQPVRPAGRLSRRRSPTSLMEPHGLAAVAASKASFVADKPFGGIRVHV